MGYSRIVENWHADDIGFYTPLDISMLYGCSDGVDVMPLADQAKELGFDGGRIFGGRLIASSDRPQHQRPEDMAARIAQAADQFAARGLELDDVLITDSAQEWDFAREVDAHGTVARDRPNVRIELANEIGHSTQRRWTIPELARLASQLRGLGYSKALTAGAALAHDELMPPKEWGGLEEGADQNHELIYPPGDIENVLDTHYDRGRWPFWENVAHGANELRKTASQYRRARKSGEPGRQDHPDVLSGVGEDGYLGYPYLLGLSATGFGNRTVYHCSQARDAQRLTGYQLEGAKWFIRGGRALPRGRYDFENANNTGAWPNSPIKSAAFCEGPATNTDQTVWRAWSFRHADTGQWYLVLSGPSVDRPGLEFQHGFHLGPQVDRFNNYVHVFQLVQG